MTKTRMRAIARLYIETLKLGSWNIELDFDTELARGDAEVAWTWDYDEATIRLDAKQWRAWSDEKAMRVVAHELVHVLMRDLMVAVEETLDQLPKRLRPLAHARYDHELEGVTERVAALIS